MQGDNLDDIFKDALDNREFSFDQNNWLKAEQMIAKKERKKRAGIIAWASGIAALLTLVGGLFWLTPSAEHSPKPGLSHLHALAAKAYPKQTRGAIEMALRKEGEGVRPIAVPVAPVNNATGMQVPEKTRLNEAHQGVVSAPKVEAQVVPQLEAQVVPVIEALKFQEVEALKVDTVKADTIKPTITKVETTKTEMGNTAVASLAADPDFNSWSLEIMGGLISRTDCKPSPVLGLKLVRNMNAHLNVFLGMAYSYMQENESDTKTFSSIGSSDYSFGYTKHVIEIATDKTHYLMVPIGLGYRLGKNNIEIGVAGYALFNATNIVKSYDESYGEISHVSTKKAYGYYNGYKDVTADFMIGYTRQLSTHFALGASINYGITPMKNVHYFDGDNDHDDTGSITKNIGGQLVLLYRIYAHKSIYNSPK